MRQNATPLRDDELVEKMRAGDAESFAILLRRHERSVSRLIRAVLRDDAAVDDVRQDTYVRAFVHLEELCGAGAFSPWLRRIALRQAIQRVRDARRSPFCVGELEAFSPRGSPEGDAGRAQLREAIQTAIDALPEGARKVFLLRSVEGWSVAETAAMLGVLPQTVKVRLFRARAKLQQALAAWADRDAPGDFSFASQ